MFFFSVYEKRHRFGNHLKVGLKDAPRDGLLRIGKERSEFESTRMNSLWAHFADCNIDESKFAFLKNYTCNCISELLRFFRATSNKIFERRAFFESISQRERQRKLGQASNLDANIMPPPVIPMQSPSSILSSASGPSSSGLLFDNFARD